jgi:hypothetical protein
MVWWDSSKPSSPSWERSMSEDGTSVAFGDVVRLSRALSAKIE